MLHCCLSHSSPCLGKADDEGPGIFLPTGHLSNKHSSGQVKLLEVMEVMDKDTFEFKFGNELTYTTVLSDQRMVELIPNGSNTVVRYEDRKEFIRLVQKARLEESKEQVMLFHSVSGH